MIEYDEHVRDLYIELIIESTISAVVGSCS